MSDPRITVEAAEALARALRNNGWQKTSHMLGWANSLPTTRERHTREAESLLEAALPHLAPQMGELSAALLIVDGYDVMEGDEVPERELWAVVEAARKVLEGAAPPVVDREALQDLLTRHWFEYIGEEEGFDCGCNERGTLLPMPTVTEAASHLADAVLVLLNGSANG